MIDILFLVLGIIGLWLGTELVVRNAIAIAHRFNVSELFIGLTILAFGTDLPELVVAIQGALHNAQGIDSSGIITGNAIGSCISQISLVIGTAAVFHYLSIGKIQLKYFGIELIGSIIILVLVSIDGTITWDNGALLIIAFLIYFFTHLLQERRNIKNEKRKPVEKDKSHVLLQVFILIIGLVIVSVSSEFTVSNALKLADAYGIKQTFIGAVIIGAGTSLPELVISVNAVLKKKPGLSIGNIIGSNIFDLFIPLGLASLISETRMDKDILVFDIPFLGFISVIVLFFLSSKKGLQRWEGLGLVALYFIYVISKISL